MSDIIKLLPKPECNTPEEALNDVLALVADIDEVIILFRVKDGQLKGRESKMTAGSYIYTLTQAIHGEFTA